MPARPASGPRDLQQTISRHSDLLLAGTVVGIVAMMIVPLPTALLDVLITANIAAAVTLLLVSIYVSDALRIAAFPSILLITTLLRLGLNVSSTRLILLQADAGEVIRSFGNFVVAGNLVVGVVVFLILTIIQFVVIAKGSERVAEVAARFTLDAMPGKQMAIDADLRGGAIDMDGARRQRSALQRESQLYGSMDGAMKFVKGDAIASILITIINIVGGLLIGILQRKMSAADAGALYTLLTVGDGLVSQIPALLISVAAGIVVTRVASEDKEGSHLGRDIGEQVLAQPRAIAIAAALLALLALVPGLPTVPFLVMAVIAGGVAYGLRARGRGSSSSSAAAALRRRGGAAAGAARGVAGYAGASGGGDVAPGAEDEGELAPASLVALELGEALLSQAEGPMGARLMGELIPGLREMLHGELGVALPGVHVRAAPPEVAPDGYRVLLGEVPMAEGRVDIERTMVVATPAELAGRGVSDARRAEAPGAAQPLCSVPGDVAAELSAAGLTVLDVPTQLTLHLGQLARRYAYEMVGIQEAQQLLDALERTHPALVNEVVPKLAGIQTVTEVLRRLVEEGVSIRNLRAILQALAEWAPVEDDAVVLTEHVRSALRRQLSYAYAPAGALRALMLDPMIEDAVAESIQKTDKGSYLAMEPELSHDIIGAVAEAVDALPPDEPLPAVLTNMQIRRYVRRLLEVELPGVPVLSYGELEPTVAVTPLARVAVGGA